MTVETTTTFTADEIAGVAFECPHCPTTISVTAAASLLADRDAVQCPSCQGFLWVQGMKCCGREFVLALLALQKAIAQDKAHPPATKPVIVRMTMPAPAAGATA